MILTYIFAIAIMIHWLLAVSDGHFWQPAEFKNVVNPDFENLKHLQNLGHFSLTAGFMSNSRFIDADVRTTSTI